MRPFGETDWVARVFAYEYDGPSGAWRADVILRIAQYGNAGQGSAFYEFQECAAAGGHVCYVVFDATCG